MTKKRRLLCEYGPVFYALSLRKEFLRRDIKDLFSRERFARRRSGELLPHIVKGHRSQLLRQLEGVDMRLQHNKVNNLGIAADKINGLMIAQGQTFSFWRMIGSVSARKGYQEGLTIVKGKPHSDVGGGLCQLANMVHWLVLNSPLTVTELHHHSDALFPDSGRRVPFGTGTSVFYKNVDYRFCNNTGQTVQLALWLEEGSLCGELRAERPFDCRYRVEEEDHCFVKEGADYYRVSKVYQRAISRETGETVARLLVLDNHSRVMYDHSLIPKAEIKEVMDCDAD